MDGPANGVLERKMLTRLTFDGIGPPEGLWEVPVKTCQLPHQK